MKLTLLAFAFVSVVSANSCDRYVHDVRKAHYQVFGLDFPYHYGVAQLQKESDCRDVISGDGIGSQGMAQITYRWWKKFLDSKGIDDIRSVRNQTLAQAYIMKNSKEQAFSKRMYSWYMVYNGGGGINTEIKKAREDLGIVDIKHHIAMKYCTRNKIIYGKTACEINYDYPVKIYEYAKRWKLFGDGGYKFW